MVPGANSWHPSCVVKLTIRFDEALQVAGTGETSTPKEADAISQVSRVQGQAGKTNTRYPMFSAEGPQFYTRALAYNRRYAVDPPWFTVLSPQDEPQFRSWVNANRVPFNPTAAITDYDMRGFWLDEIKPGGVWDGGHFPDTWKTPYDTTFSGESKYALPGAPLEWTGERLFNTATGDFIFGEPIRTKAPSSQEKPRRPRRRDPIVTIGRGRAITNDALSELDETRDAYEALDQTPGVGAIANQSGAQPGDPRDTVPLTFGTDSFTVIANRVPKRGVFTLPHPRTAATFTLIFDYLEFPIDPRLIRAVGVEVHLGTVSAEDYARGMAGDRDSTGRPLSILKTTTNRVDPVTGRPGVNNGTLLFYGTADTWDVEHSEAGSTVQIKGRDIRGIFIDAKVPLAKVSKVDLDQPIDAVVRDIITTMGVDADLRMTVAVDEAEWPDGVVPSPGDAEGRTRVRIKAGGEGASSTPATGGKTSYWDLITNYCTIVGAMPQIVGSTLWVRPVRRVFDLVSRRATTATPFAGGQPRRVGTEELRVRRLVFGRDIKRLSFSRKFGGIVVPTIQCVSFDDRAAGKQRLIFGQWPPDDTVTAKTKGADEILRVPMYGIRSVEQLTQIAHGIYEEVGRGETGGQAETKNLASLGGDNADPDLLRIRPTEPIEFAIDATALRTIAPVVSEVNEAARRTFSEEVDILHRRIGDRLVARALVALARGAVRELLTFYQVTGVEFEFGEGIRTTIAFQNYIVPRHEVAEPAADRRGDVRSSPVDVVGAHRKGKVSAPSVTVGAGRNLDGPAGAGLTTPKRPRNLAGPSVTVGPGTRIE